MIVEPHARHSRRHHSNIERQHTKQSSDDERWSYRQQSAHEQSRKGRESAHGPWHGRHHSPESSRSKRPHGDQEIKHAEHWSYRERYSDKQQSAHEQPHKERQCAQVPRPTGRQSPAGIRAGGTTGNSEDGTRSGVATKSGGATSSKAPTRSRTRNGGAPTGQGLRNVKAPRTSQQEATHETRKKAPGAG